MTRATTRRTSGGRNASQGLRFDERLVLNQWMLGLFGIKDFNTLAERLRDPQLEGFDEDNVSRFYRTLSIYLPAGSPLTADLLLGYDQNIVRHWLAITERRNRAGHTLYPKYFQYLALLFTEIYLDRYFQDVEQLCNDLNSYLTQFNLQVAEADRIDLYEPGQLNKLAYWNATGSGKTLLMHINIRQFRHYLKLYGREGELNRIILLTPNEGLSNQHLDELGRSGMEAELFVKEGRGLFAGQSVEIIDIHKLKDDSGNKTVAIDAFEGNNLVLVDEGHRGSSGEDWKAKRDRLCEQGFSFEYSATFGQAMKAANKRHLTQEYARCILFDYSYKYFYQDGYGKDYRILNLEDDRQEEIRDLYLTACLMVFYQQLRLYQECKQTFQPYLIDRPLWVFVGGTVTKTLSTKDASDIIEILLFLARLFVTKRKQLVVLIDCYAAMLVCTMAGVGKSSPTHLRI